MSKYEIFNHLMENAQWDDFTEFAVFNRINRGYSFFNSALILLQKSGATIVRSETQWKHRNRAILPGTPPIVIMQPGGPVALVYDYSDTYGKKDDVLERIKMLKANFADRPRHILEQMQYLNMLEQLNKHGFLYGEEAFGERQGGLVALLEYPVQTYYTKKNRQKEEVTVTVDAYHRIVINSRYGYHDKALALFHELGHIYCGHLDGVHTEQNEVPRYRENLPHEQKEFEAEMVCKVICEKFDLIEECHDYLQQFVVNDKEPYYSKAAVYSAADKIVKILNLSYLSYFSRMESDLEWL